MKTRDPGSTPQLEDDLQAIIEEARQRTRRRRRRVTAVLGAVAATGIAAFIVIRGGGGDQSNGAPDPGEVSLGQGQESGALHSCPPRDKKDGSTSAGSWSGQVSGIGCYAAGHLILHELLSGFDSSALSNLNVNDMQEVAANPPGAFAVAGFVCTYGQHDPRTGWQIDCVRSGKRIVFHATP